MFSRRHFLVTAAAATAAPAFAATESTAPVVEDWKAELIASLPGNTEGRYNIPEAYWATLVEVNPNLPVGEIHILPQTKHLYFTVAPGYAIRYGCAIGSEGLAYFGTGIISRKVEWPSWTPTPDMIEREPEKYEQYADGMPGGPTNPLGARALYVYENGRDTAIRVHGTTNPRSIGSASSNGCFRMYNSHVIDLYDRVPIGTKIHAY